MNKELQENKEHLNVLGQELQVCSCKPLTICCVMDDNFLKYSKSQGNDLITPMPMYSFTGLKNGDHWCICLDRWKQALFDGLAPMVILESTNIVVLESLSLEILKEYQFNKK